MLPARLAPNFSLAEYEAVSDPVPEQLQAALMQSVAGLQRVREAVGVPMRLTSGYRTSTHNENVGGSKTSDHMDARAFDFVPLGMSLHDWYVRFRQKEAAGEIPAYDQLIMYPFTTGHIHIGFGTRMRRQHLIKVNETEYKPLISESQIPKKGIAIFAVVLVLAIIAVLIIFNR